MCKLGNNIDSMFTYWMFILSTYFMHTHCAHCHWHMINYPTQCITEYEHVITDCGIIVYIYIDTYTTYTHTHDIILWLYI